MNRPVGEMNPDQLHETCLDPEKRTLKRVHINNPSEIDEVIRKLMGSDSKIKQRFLATGEL